jgi:hypothetical protein
VVTAADLEAALAQADAAIAGTRPLHWDPARVLRDFVRGLPPSARVHVELDEHGERQVTTNSVDQVDEGLPR